MRCFLGQWTRRSRQTTRQALADRCKRVLAVAGSPTAGKEGDDDRERVERDSPVPVERSAIDERWQ